MLASYKQTICPVQCKSFNFQTHFTGTHQYYFEFPRCAHGLIVQSPVTTPNAPDCFLQMLLDFVDDPTVAPSSACLSDIEPINFQGAHVYSQYLFGTNDLWENSLFPPVPPPTSPSISPSNHAPKNPPPGFDAAQRWLRQNVPTPRFLRERPR